MKAAVDRCRIFFILLLPVWFDEHYHLMTLLSEVLCDFALLKKNNKNWKLFNFKVTLGLNTQLFQFISICQCCPRHSRSPWFRIQFLIFKWTIKSTLKHFLILVTKMGQLEDFSLHSQKDLNSGCLTVLLFISFLKQSPTQIYKLNCLSKVCTGHNILASYRLSRKTEVYNQNKKPVRRQNREKQQVLNKGENERHDCFLQHRMTTLVGDVDVYAFVWPPVALHGQKSQ